MSDLRAEGLSLNQSANQTACGETDRSAHPFFMVVQSLVFLAGLILNGFTLRVYFCRAQQPTSSSVTVYLKNLAAADFLLSLCLPLRIIYYSASGSGPLRLLYCNFGASAFYLNMYASILFMGYIAANRYLKIVHPLGTHILQTVRAAHVISTVTWAVLLAMMSAYIMLSLLTQEASSSDPNAATCDLLHSRQLSLFYKVLHAVMAAIFLLVLTSLIFFYYSTSRRLAQAQQKQPATSRKFAKSRRNMLVLVSIFCVCFVPYHLVRLPFVFLRCRSSSVFYVLKELSVTVSVLNVCLDPLIYFIFCRAFRAQLSLRRVFSTTQGGTAEQRSTAKFHRRASLSTLTMTQQNQHVITNESEDGRSAGGCS